LIDKKITWGFLLSATCRSLKQTASGTRLNINIYLSVGVASHFLPITMFLNGSVVPAGLLIAVAQLFMFMTAVSYISASQILTPFFRKVGIYPEIRTVSHRARFYLKVELLVMVGGLNRLWCVIRRRFFEVIVWIMALSN